MKSFKIIRQKNLFIVYILLIIISSGCQQPKKQVEKPPKSIVVSDSVFNASCPYLTYNAKGDPVLSWVQQNSINSVPMVCYAIFSDSSKTFGRPHPVPSSKGVEPHGENMPKIIFQKNGNILVIYSIKAPHPGNPYTGAVYYTRSFDEGKHWMTAKPLIKEASQSYDQRYFDVAVLPNGKTGIVWLNNSKPEGSTLYFASLNGDQGFSKGKVIGKHTCQCCRTDLLVDSSGKINVAWRDIYHDSIRDMFYCYSADTGKTFSDPVRISADNWVVNGCPHTGPSMAENKSGLHFTWFTMGGGGGIYYCHTINNSQSFSPRQAVSRLTSARHPQMIAMPDGDLAIAWDEGVKYGDEIHQRIGLQMRGPDGLLLNNRYLTPDSENTTFPVIKVLNKQNVLVAYTQDDGKRQQVRYKIVTVGL